MKFLRSLLSSVAILVISTLGILWVPVAQAGLITSIDPRATYLRTYQDVALDAAPIDLLAAGITPGESIRLTVIGDYRRGSIFSDSFTDLIGVFSSSSSLAASDNLNRVTDAIDAGADVLTLPTFYGGLPTDILQDFAIGPDFVDIVVPTAARFLFVSANDHFFGDNTDPDGDFAVQIAVNAVPEPGSVVMLSTGILGLLCYGWRHRKTTLTLVRSGEA